MTLAPIIVFVYNRPWHTEKALEALALNDLAKDSLLYIYADGPKKNASKVDLEKIAQTRKVIYKKQWCKEVKVICSELNLGLADSVISGTKEVLRIHAKVITIEDDVIVSKHFLEYMNNALERYKDNDKVWMVSGYFWPIDNVDTDNRSFFLPVSTTQAWGTWQRVWNQFEVAAPGYERLKSSSALRKKFNLDNSFDFTGMLMMQMEKFTIDSWAIRFWWSMFKNKGLILFPDKSLIKNIGWDGSGVHCGADTQYREANFENSYSIKVFPKRVIIDRQQLRLVKTFHRNLNPREEITLKNRVFGWLIQKREKLKAMLST